MKEKTEMYKSLLRQIPVSINNFYGDPTLQWSDTLTKLDDLLETHHEGPVGLILKGRLCEGKVADLRLRKDKGLNIVVLVSISELRSMENVGHEHRYENIRLLNEVGVPAIGYIRPLTPPYNTNRETINYIFRRLSEVNCRAAVVAGFRGDEMLVNEMQPAEVTEWVLRVKQITPEIWSDTLAASKEFGVQLFTRTSCAVDFLLGHKWTYNPYYNSPKLVKCSEVSCPLLTTCQGLSEPREGSIEFLKELGYDVKFVAGNEVQQKCDVEASNRLKCISCCTTCFFLNENPHIEVRGKIRLGDLTFMRFLTGMICQQDGCRDKGMKDVGEVNFPNFPKVPEITCLNSWWPIATAMKKCFDCKYCIEKYYIHEQKSFGFNPSRLLEMIELPEDRKTKVCKKSFTYNNLFTNS